MKEMKIWFAKLDGDIVGIDHYVRFMATENDAQETADMYAEENYLQYDVEEDGKWRARVEPWSDEKHGKYIGQACFTDYTDEA